MGKELGKCSLLQRKMQEKQKTGLVWFRNDLRVGDNQSLLKARAENDRLIGVYCFDPRHFAYTELGFRKTEKYRAQFLLDSVSQLRQELEKLNISLLVYHEKPEKVIPNLVEKYEAETIYCQKEWTREEVDVLDGIKSGLHQSISVCEIYDQFLFHPEDCPFSFDQIPEVFTNFRKTCEKNAEIRNIPDPINAFLPEHLLSTKTEIPTLGDLGLNEFESDPRTNFPFRGGELEGLARLNDYFFKTKRLGFYKKTRNGLNGTDYSSKFSPWLANGCLSPRQIYWEVRRFEKEHYKNQSTYWLIFELIWRDYFKYISLKHGDKIFHLGGILQKQYDWKVDQGDLQKWIDGHTPESFVNANMIELKETGWMSNRGRQNVASYLAKDMEVDWRWGAAYFEAMLIDYDVHSNYGNWMYVSGVGNDPRDRKFNVRSQAERYDPNGKYQYTWLQTTLF